MASKLVSDLYSRYYDFKSRDDVKTQHYDFYSHNSDSKIEMIIFILIIMSKLLTSCWVCTVMEEMVFHVKQYSRVIWYFCDCNVLTLESRTAVGKAAQTHQLQIPGELHSITSFFFFLSMGTDGVKEGFKQHTLRLTAPLTVAEIPRRADG